MSENEKQEVTVDLESLQYTQEQADKEPEYPLIKEGLMRVCFGRAERGVNPQNGNLFIRVKVSPVTEENKVLKRATADLTLVLPVINPSWPKHEEPDTMGLCWRALTTLDKDFPRFGRKSKSGGGFEDGAGTSIDKTAYDTIRKQVRLAVGKRMVELYKDPDLLSDEVCFAVIEHTRSKKDETKIYARVKYITDKPKDGEPVITSDFIVS